MVGRDVETPVLELGHDGMLGGRRQRSLDDLDGVGEEAEPPPPGDGRIAGGAPRRRYADWRAVLSVAPAIAVQPFEVGEADNPPPNLSRRAPAGERQQDIGMVFRLAVMSSPMTPFPQVAPTILCARSEVTAAPSS
jgi:hypothetical protein